MSNVKNIGNRVTIARKPMTQRALAENLNVSLKTVNNWETERTSPTIAMLKEIARVTGVSETWLITGIGDKQSGLSDGNGITIEPNTGTILHEVTDSSHKLPDAFKEFLKDQDVNELMNPTDEEIQCMLDLEIGRSFCPRKEFYIEFLRGLRRGIAQAVNDHEAIGNTG